MATPAFKNTVKEAQNGLGHSPDSSQKVEQQRDSKEINEAKNAGVQAYLDVVGLDETGETMGKVSEVLSEVKERQGDGASTAGTKAQGAKYDPAAIKAQLLSKLPPEKEMRAQIEKEIKKEIKYLHKKAMKMLKAPGKVNYFEMTNLLRKIRDLKGLLFTLVRASMDGLKTLWLKFVHGIM